MARPKNTIPQARADVRLPAALKARIEKLAAQEGRSLNAQIVELLREAMKRARIKNES